MYRFTYIAQECRTLSTRSWSSRHQSARSHELHHQRAVGHAKVHHGARAVHHARRVVYVQLHIASSTMPQQQHQRRPPGKRPRLQRRGQQSVATPQAARRWARPPCRLFKNQSC